MVAKGNLSYCDVVRTLDGVSAEFTEFWSERRLCTLVTLRADGSPHVVPVGVTLDLDAGLARVICSRGSVKARNAARSKLALASSFKHKGI